MLAQGKMAAAYPTRAEALIVAAAEELMVKTMARYDPSHDAFHVQRVRKNALHLARTVSETLPADAKPDLLIVELAALLHDVLDKKYVSAEEAGDPYAFFIPFFKEAAAGSGLDLIDDGRARLITRIVENVSWSTEKKLIATGKINDCTSALHAPEGDPAHESSAIQHFHDKLLHIKDRLKTEPGKRLAEKRHKLMLDFLQAVDGTPIWGQRQIDGPGVWVTCVKGKERQVVGELYDLFESLANDLWPQESATTAGASENSDEEDGGADDLERQIAKEVESMKRPRKETRFVVFISCKPPVDPVKLVTTHVENVMRTGVTHTRYTQRLTPVAGTSVANIPEIQSLCGRLVREALAAEPEKKFSYKIELRMRNHSTLKREMLIPEIAKCVPEGHTVSLDNPELFILVEVFKVELSNFHSRNRGAHIRGQSVCGISVVRDYYKLHKFNVVEIANAKNLGDDGADSRVQAEKIKKDVTTAYGSAEPPEAASADGSKEKL
ncbi:hypothetical protein BN946_scf184988.g7 [Trametes cinnabarina]|uniref:THUMP domain-containing protein n=1 Tax=Pycnoporus cinnabarinus TaxID=5643 RepID=A0A060SKK3_PYCCI|nr:hypothetical protein BN946_scf184988.g7 [Trametes cinnabarina]